MHVQRQIDRLLEQRAAEWIEILKAGNPRDRAAFVEWLRQSKLHVERYLEMVAIDRELQRIDATRSEDVDALLKRIAPNILTLDQSSAAPARAVGTSSRQQATWRKGMALAAGFVLCVMLVQWLAGTLRSPNRYATTVGEQRTIALADGSVITLNTLSAVEIDYSPTRRNIELESGEAVFKVAHDASRPFVVHTPTATVRAVGTQFNVYQRAEDTLVSVLEGRVHVTAQQSPSGLAHAARPMQSLAAGEEAQVAASGRIAMRRQPDVSKTVAWRERRLIFDETPLEEMVREFNRYGRSVHIRIEGIEPGSRRYGGIFDVDDPSSLAELLAREPDLIVENNGGEIVIRGRRLLQQPRGDQPP